jgi:hypothetical protein
MAVPLERAGTDPFRSLSRCPVRRHDRMNACSCVVCSGGGLNERNHLFYSVHQVDERASIHSMPQLCGQRQAGEIRSRGFLGMLNCDGRESTFQTAGPKQVGHLLRATQSTRRAAFQFKFPFRLGSSVFSARNGQLQGRTRARFYLSDKLPSRSGC